MFVEIGSYMLPFVLVRWLILSSLRANDIDSEMKGVGGAASIRPVFSRAQKSGLHL